MTTSGLPEPSPDKTRGWPVWLPSALTGIGLALFGLFGFYLGIFFALGAQPMLAGLAMFALVPLVSLLAGWLLRPRFRGEWVKWTLITAGIAVAAEVVQAMIIFTALGNPEMISRVGLFAVLQQALGVPFALVASWLAGRSGRP